MNGNKRIDNPRMKIVKCVDAEAHVTPYLWAGNPCITPSNTVVYLIKCVCMSHVSLVGFLRNVIYVSVASEFGYRCFFFLYHLVKPATHLAILYADRGEFDCHRSLRTHLAIFFADRNNVALQP